MRKILPPFFALCFPPPPDERRSIEHPTSEPSGNCKVAGGCRAIEPTHARVGSLDAVADCSWKRVGSARGVDHHCFNAFEICLLGFVCQVDLEAMLDLLELVVDVDEGFALFLEGLEEGSLGVDELPGEDGVDDALDEKAPFGKVRASVRSPEEDDTVRGDIDTALVFEVEVGDARGIVERRLEEGAAQAMSDPEYGTMLAALEGPVVTTRAGAKALAVQCEEGHEVLGMVEDVALAGASGVAAGGDDVRIVAVHDDVCRGTCQTGRKKIARPEGASGGTLGVGWVGTPGLGGTAMKTMEEDDVDGCFGGGVDRSELESFNE